MRVPPSLDSVASAIRDGSLAVSVRRRRAALMLKRRTPQEWLRRVKLILDHDVQVATACVIWWDAFGGRSYKNRWPHLDRYLDAKYVPVPNLLIAKELVRAGYPAYSARQRIFHTQRRAFAAAKGWSQWLDEMADANEAWDALSESYYTHCRRLSREKALLSKKISAGLAQTAGKPKTYNLASRRNCSTSTQ